MELFISFVSYVLFHPLVKVGHSLQSEEVGAASITGSALGNLGGSERGKAIDRGLLDHNSGDYRPGVSEEGPLVVAVVASFVVSLVVPG